MAFNDINAWSARQGNKKASRAYDALITNYDALITNYDALITNYLLSICQLTGMTSLR